MISAAQLDDGLDVIFHVGCLGVIVFAVVSIPCLLFARYYRRRMPLSSRLSRAIDLHWYGALLRGEHHAISDPAAQRSLSAYRHCLLGCILSLALIVVAFACGIAMHFLH